MMELFAHQCIYLFVYNLFGCQVVRSTGKHANAMLAFPQWIRINAPRFMDKRLLSMNYGTKVALFNDLCEVASQPDGQLEMLKLSANATRKLIADDLTDAEKMMVADVLLIGINKNEKHVKSIAANYRKTAARTKIAIPRNPSVTTVDQMDEPAVDPTDEPMQH